MLLYIISIVYFVFAFMSSTKTGFISKLIWLVTVALGVYDLYSIFTLTISESFLTNLLLAILPFVMIILALAFLVAGDDKNDKDNVGTSSPARVSQETQAQKSSYAEIKAEPPVSAPEKAEVSSGTKEENKISYRNQRLENFGVCDVEEIGKMIKITINFEGRTYEFFAQGGNIESYRTDGMKDPVSY